MIGQYVVSSTMDIPVSDYSILVSEVSPVEIH